VNGTWKSETLPRHSNHHADGGGLARAVWSQQAEHAARLNVQAQVMHGDLTAKRLRNTIQLHNFHRMI